MEWTSLQSTLHGSGIALTTGLIAVTGVVLWWIVRRRVRDFWLPIIRVFDFPASRLPRVIFRRPPWIPFLMFLIAAMSLFVWSLRPSLRVFSDFEPGMSQIHVFVDMSPSMSAQISLTDLSERLAAVLQKIGPKSRVTIGTSHGSEVYEISSPSAAVDIITGLGFHRGGVKIGAAMRAQVARIGEIDQLFIISDRDRHSWSGFQWQYLLVDADIRHEDVDSSNQRSAKANIYIQDATYLSAPGSLTMDWDVVISEGALTMPASGTLNASINGESIATGNWEIASGQRSTTVSISWPAMKVPEGIKNQNIQWSVEVQGGDAMTMDNKFIAPLSGRRDRVAIVADLAGEMHLDDPMMPLAAALDVAGYSVARYDRWPRHEVRQGLDLLGQPRLIIAQAESFRDLQEWCPEISHDKEKSPWMGAIWLVPRDLDSSFEGLCHCVARFSSNSKDLDCSTGMTRDAFIASLVALGGLQVAGEIGQAKGSLALRLPKQAESIELVAFTVPLRPDSRLGMTWGTFPVLMRELGGFLLGSGDTEGAGGGRNTAGWPRISDVSSLSQVADRGDAARIARETNVPVGESMLGLTPINELPPSFGAVGGVGRDRAPNKRDSDDPWPWVRLLSGSVICAMAIELIWSIYRGRRNSIVSMLFFVIAAGLVSPENASADVKIDWLAERNVTNVSFQTLAREVASRTSIELAAKLEPLSQFDQSASAKPWIWVSSPSKLAGKDGSLTHDATLWLKRGGLLILDGENSDHVLENLMRSIRSGTINASGWMNVPPDHEFMRSFYLLSALPSCKGRPWKIYSFDGRVTAIAIPYSLLGQLQDSPARWNCDGALNYEQHVRVFVNLLMMALTTDYKRDQIHLPEILKRLRVP